MQKHPTGLMGCFPFWWDISRPLQGDIVSFYAPRFLPINRQGLERRDKSVGNRRDREIKNTLKSGTRPVEGSFVHVLIKQKYYQSNLAQC